MKLLNSTQIAAKLGRGRSFISAMKAAGYRMKYGRYDVVPNALAWLEAHPDFRTTQYHHHHHNNNSKKNGK